MGFFENRKLRKHVSDEAAALRSVIAETRQAIEVAARTFREEFATSPGFSPTCPRCGRGMVYRPQQMSRKKWRSMLQCRDGCHLTPQQLKQAKESVNG